jgi:hypothetical protein
MVEMLREMSHALINVSCKWTLICALHYRCNKVFFTVIMRVSYRTIQINTYSDTDPRDMLSVGYRTIQTPRHNECRL